MDTTTSSWSNTKTFFKYDKLQPHPHGAILRHFLSMINSFLFSATNYFENRLLPNDLTLLGIMVMMRRTNGTSGGR
jgi:hypothetical protein